MNHDIPEHLIPAQETVVGASEEEIKLNESLDTDRWVYTEEPDDGLCPYCGCEYKRASWASNHVDAGKGVCPYDTSISDFIVDFVHSENRDRYTGTRSVGAFCSPAYDDEFVTYPNMPDYDIKRF